MDNNMIQPSLNILGEIDNICKKLNIKYFIAFGSLIGTIRHKGFIPWDDDIDIMMFREDYELFVSEANTYLSKNYFLQTIFSDKNFDKYPARVRKSDTTFIGSSEIKLIEQKGCCRNFGYFISIFPLDKYPGSESKWKKQKFWLNLRLRLLKTSTLKPSSVKSFFAWLYCLLVGRKSIYKRLHNSFSKYNKLDTNVYHYADILNLRKHPLLFSKTDFSETILLPFEDTMVPVPIGYDNVLKTIYGDYMKLPPEKDRICAHSSFINSNMSYTEFIKEKLWKNTK